MKGFMKKILSAGLAFALVFTMCPVLAYADTPQEAQEKTAEATVVEAEGTENTEVTAQKTGNTEIQAAESEAPEVETTEVKAESADEKNTVLVYGRYEGSQHWTKDNIYYILTDGTLINPVIVGDLTIDPGTTICLGQGDTSHGQIKETDVKSASGFRVLYGSITAKGTEEEPIIFKNDTNDKAWGGITFDTQIEDVTKKTCESATFEHCQFINGGGYSNQESVLTLPSTRNQSERSFNFTVDQCTFDSTGVTAAKTAEGKALVNAGAAIFCNDIDRIVDMKITNSTFRDMGRAILSDATDYVYPENFSCLIEGNNFESGAYYYNRYSKGMSHIDWSANAVIRNNTFHNTTGNDLLGPACWLRGGWATYEVEGNNFIGNTDATGENANQYAPVVVRVGANINADTTKTYAANTCNYGAEVGEYAEVTGYMQTPGVYNTITGQTGYLGKLEGFDYRLQGLTIENSRTLTLAPGITCYTRSDQNVYEDGKLVAKGTKEEPIRFIGDGSQYGNNICISAGWADGDYDDKSAATIFENCTFENKLGINVTAVVTINGKPTQELPLTLYMKDCQMKEVRRGIGINLRTGSSDYSNASRVEVHNVSIRGRDEGGEDDDYGIQLYGQYNPGEAALTEISNCQISNFKEGRGLYAYLEAYDESSQEKVGKQSVLDHLTLTGCNTGILNYGPAMPVVKNSIIAGNTTTLQLKGTDVDKNSGQKITYSCLYNTVKSDNLSDYGTGCIAKDPCFADAASGDFHLKSAAGRWNGTTWVKDTVTSPCIDAGETSAAYANEPTPNGNRANMGAYGNTTEASKSTSGGSTDPSDPGQTCKHTSTEARNQKAATCETAGYTGDTYCKSCNTKLSTGKSIAAKGHSAEVRDQKAATCTVAGYTGDTYCKTCNKKLSTGKSIAAKGHSTTTKTQKATASKDGKITTTCTRCGTTTKTVKIAKVSKIKLSKTKYTYNGKKQTPSVTVKDSKGKELKVNTDYKVKLPSGRKNVGTYEVKITFKGSKYSGSKTLSYTINPKSTKLSKVSAKKKGFEAKWKKQSTQTKGYQIQYSTDSKFKSGNKTVTVNKNSTTKKTISKLKAKKKYYVRIRTYKTVGKQKYYSDWSKSVKVTTKK